MRRMWISVLALLCVACIGAQPLGGSIGLRRPSLPTAVPSPTALPAGIGTEDVPSVFGPVSVVPTPELATYRDDIDVRELYRDLQAYADQPLRYHGTVWTTVEQNELLFVQIRVPFGTGPDDWRAIVVLFPLYRISVDGSALREGTKVVVWGRPRTMLRFTDDAGTEVEQPLLLGDRIEVVE
ncbi:MAG: hypothetical protein RMK01_00035 [Thermomicrobium sp.]|nr:hypothetical protein [Thermomicrobium sp.]MDW8058444.1 hypothetical protein [Thermomicrobium sp.]